AAAGFDEAVLLLLSEVVAQEILCRLDLFREIPNPHQVICRRNMPSGGAFRRNLMVDDLVGLALGPRDGGLCLAGPLVGADGVENHGAFATVEAAVIVRVIPREDLLLHGFCEERSYVLDRFHSLW